MSKFRGHKSLADYVYSLPGNESTCISCKQWDTREALFECPKGGLVHRAQMMPCHEGGTGGDAE